MPIIALTGTMGAGKGTVVKYLKSKGFEYYTYSDILREEAKNLGYKPTRENLQKIGNMLRKDYKDMGILSKKLLEKIKSDKVVLDGVRNIAEINALRQRKDFYLIGIDSNQKLRFERLKNRARKGDPKTFEEFKKIDDKENKSIGSGQEIFKCLERADYLIENDGTIGELREKVDEILEKVV